MEKENRTQIFDRDGRRIFDVITRDESHHYIEVKGKKGVQVVSLEWLNKKFAI